MSRLLVTASLALAFPFFAVGQSQAEGLNGEQIKKLLIGNTVHNETESERRRVKTRRWIYFPDATTRVGQVIRTRKGSDRFTDFVASWRVTPEGTFCHKQPEGDEETCRNNVRLNGNMIEMDGVGELFAHEAAHGRQKHKRPERQDAEPVTAAA